VWRWQSLRRAAVTGCWAGKGRGRDKPAGLAAPVAAPRAGGLALVTVHSDADVQGTGCRGPPAGRRCHEGKTFSWDKVSLRVDACQCPFPDRPPVVQVSPGVT